MTEMAFNSLAPGLGWVAGKGVDYALARSQLSANAHAWSEANYRKGDMLDPTLASLGSAVGLASVIAVDVLVPGAGGEASAGAKVQQAALRGVGGLDDAAIACASGRCTNGVCFVAGTPVVTLDGRSAIEELQVGDLVLSRDEQTGRIAYREVVSTFVNPAQSVLAIGILDEKGAETSIGVTPTHPFWVVGAGWVIASQLVVGDNLLTATGGWAWVIEQPRDAGVSTVYNIEVEGFHTYFAGEAQTWVHNSCFDVIRKANGLPENARLTQSVNDVFSRLERFHAVDPRLASERLHDIKAATGRGAADNVVFDMTGNVFSPETGELLGSLTEGGSKLIK
jgi:hypothetical protein